jgi:hypothetical protein
MADTALIGEFVGAALVAGSILGVAVWLLDLLTGGRG